MAGILVAIVLVLAAIVLFLLRDRLFGDDSSPAVGAVPERIAPRDSHPAGDGLDVARAPAAEGRESSKVEPEAAARPEGKDPSSIDLGALPDFGPTPDTTAEEWARMSEWMAQWMDVDAGAAGEQARRELLKQTRKAVPSILNGFKRQDFAIVDGRLRGDQCRKALEQICNGASFDWRSADLANGRPVTHPDDVWFCKHVVEQWSSAWQRAERDVRAWIQLARLEEKDPAEARRLLERFGGQVPEPTVGAPDDEVE